MTRARLNGDFWWFYAAQICLSRCAYLFLGLFFLVISAGVVGSAKAGDSRGQLVMITSSDCPWCEAFEDDVGKGYDLTEEALILSLIHI